jgi:hypothetical protein
MKIYDYNTAEVVDIPDIQYDFLHAFIKNDCKTDTTLKDIPGITAEMLTAWQSEPFWAILEGYVIVLKRARGLTGDYLKDFLMQVLAGRKEPTDSQLKVIGHAVKVLGLGLQPRGGFNGKVTVTPENTQIVFNDGLDVKN